MVVVVVEEVASSSDESFGRGDVKKIGVAAGLTLAERARVSLAIT